MMVVIVDYGMGNLASVQRALEECAVAAEVAADPAALARASHVVLPGVGAFGDAMARLRDGGWVAPLRQLAADGIPLLGICLGMQLLADCGEEGGAHDGLGLIPGRVVRLHPVGARERVPHVGWNEVWRSAKIRCSNPLPSAPTSTSCTATISWRRARTTLWRARLTAVNSFRSCARAA